MHATRMALTALLLLAATTAHAQDRAGKLAVGIGVHAVSPVSRLNASVRAAEFGAAPWVGLGARVLGVF